MPGKDGSKIDGGSQSIVFHQNRIIIASGILIGIGLAGIIDTIVLHEILQWHHMISNVVPPTTADSIRFNIFVDGIFLAFTLIAILAGISLLLLVLGKGKRMPPFFTRFFVGLLLLGFGLFNTFDGTVNHLVFGIHHVMDGSNPLSMDLAFLAIAGLAFIGIGVFLIKQRYSRVAAGTPANTAASA